MIHCIAYGFLKLGSNMLLGLIISAYVLSPAVLLFIAADRSLRLATLFRWCAIVWLLLSMPLMVCATSRYPTKMMAFFDAVTFEVPPCDCASDAEGGAAGSSERSEENGTPEQRGPKDAPNTSPQNQKGS